MEEIRNTSVWKFHLRSLGLAQTKGNIPESPFHVGDFVVLKELNPFKGTLKVGVPYEVQNSCAHHIQIVGDNHTAGYFNFKHFEIYTGLGKRMPIDLSQEYDDAILAQEIYDDL
jgi:hypothetical protein